MALFIVDRDVPEMTAIQVAAWLQVAKRTSEQFTRARRPVDYLRSLFLPDEARCLCLFEAPNAKVFQEVNELAQVRFTRTVEVIELPV